MLLYTYIMMNKNLPSHWIDEGGGFIITFSVLFDQKCIPISLIINCAKKFRGFKYNIVKNKNYLGVCWLLVRIQRNSNNAKNNPIFAHNIFSVQVKSY